MRVNRLAYASIGYKNHGLGVATIENIVIDRGQVSQAFFWSHLVPYPISLMAFNLRNISDIPKSPLATPSIISSSS